jgi:hypothetical protein
MIQRDNVDAQVAWLKWLELLSLSWTYLSRHVRHIFPAFMDTFDIMFSNSKDMHFICTQHAEARYFLGRHHTYIVRLGCMVYVCMFKIIVVHTRCDITSIHVVVLATMIQLRAIELAIWLAITRHVTAYWAAAVAAHCVMVTDHRWFCWSISTFCS